MNVPPMIPPPTNQKVADYINFGLVLVNSSNLWLFSYFFATTVISASRIKIPSGCHICCENEYQKREEFKEDGHNFRSKKDWLALRESSYRSEHASGNGYFQMPTLDNWDIPLSSHFTLFFIHLLMIILIVCLWETFFEEIYIAKELSVSTLAEKELSEENCAITEKRSRLLAGKDDSTLSPNCQSCQTTVTQSCSLEALNGSEESDSNEEKNNPKYRKKTNKKLNIFKKAKKNVKKIFERLRKRDNGEETCC